MEVRVNPRAILAFVLLGGFVRSCPIALGVPPQSGEGETEARRARVSCFEGCDLMRNLLLVFHRAFQLLCDFFCCIVEILFIGTPCPDHLTIFAEKRGRDGVQFLTDAVE